MKYIEDLLVDWDRRIQIEAVLLFFFSVVTSSSFISINMFYQTKNPIVDFIPIFYIVTMFCWWHTCKRLAFNTTEDNSAMMWSNSFSFILWLIITCAISFGGYDEWGWNKHAGKKHPAVDNIFRFFNCFLVTEYLCVLFYDYYIQFNDRVLRIKTWCFCLFIHALFNLAYFADWLSLGESKGILMQVLALIGSIVLIITLIIIFFTVPRINNKMLISLLIGVFLYWIGSTSLDCSFYPDTGDMTMMPGYQMLFTITILIIFESLPLQATKIFSLGTHLLIDDEDNY